MDRGIEESNSPQLVSSIHRPRCGPWFQYRSPTGFEWLVADLPIPNLPADLHGLRVIHLTDLHLRSYWTAGHDQIIEEVSERHPDLILFTGDFVESKHDAEPAMPFVERMFRGLRSRLGTFAILGNHDVAIASSRMTGCNLTMIDGQRVCLPVGQFSIELIGLRGPKRLDLQPAFLDSLPARQPDVPRIILSHFPDHFPRMRDLRPDLFLTGHTHGGQICLPGRIPILRHTSLARRFCSGIHRIDNTWYVANRGLGYSSPLPLRLFCPTEAIEITLLASNADVEPQMNADQRR